MNKKLKQDFEHHDGSRKIWKTLFILHVTACGLGAITGELPDSGLLYIVLAATACFFAAQWNGEVTVLERIKQEDSGYNE
jgi:hypothetical protein